jgi:hypothetical protein
MSVFSRMARWSRQALQEARQVVRTLR